MASPTNPTFSTNSEISPHSIPANNEQHLVLSNIHHLLQIKHDKNNYVLYGDSNFFPFSCSHSPRVCGRNSTSNSPFLRNSYDVNLAYTSRIHQAHRIFSHIILTSLNQFLLKLLGMKPLFLPRRLLLLFIFPHPRYDNN